MSKSFESVYSIQKIGLVAVLGCTFLLGINPGNANAQMRFGEPSMVNAERMKDGVGKDSDGDGVPDRADYDDDNDGIADSDDAFPLDGTRWLATDRDSQRDSSAGTTDRETARTVDENDAIAAANIAARGFAKSVRTDSEYQLAIDELVNDANAILERSGVATSRGKSTAGSAAVVDIEPTGEGITVTSLRGLRDAGLPVWAQLEALAEFGYVSWSEVPVDQLDVLIEPQAFSLDAIDVVEQVVALQSVAAKSTQAKGLFSFCESRWSSRHWDDSVKISKNGKYAPVDVSSSHGQLIGSVSGSIQGEAMADIDYATKARKCIGIPYKARLDAALVDISLYVDGSVDLTGAALLEWQKTFEKPFRLFSKTFQFRVKVFTFELRLQSDVTVGARIDARAKANINARADLLGEVEYRWECTGKKCNRTKAQERLEFSTPEDNGYDANIDVTVTPYIEVAADVRLRLKHISTLVEARAAIVAAAPLSLHLAACGQDIDADGKLENSAGIYFDSLLEVYAYFSYDYLTGKPKADSVSIGLPGFRTISVPGTAMSMYTAYPGNGLPAGELNLYKSVKVLKTAALTRGSGDLLRPVLSIAKGGISISPQRCYPFAGEPIYVIDWNDGSPHQTVSTGVTTHKGLGNFDQSVSVRIIGDTMGRTLTSPATVMEVAAGSIPVAPPTTTNPDPGPVFPETCGRRTNNDNRVCE